MLEYFQSMLDRPWQPVSRPALAAWLAFYLGFMAYAFNAHGGFLFIDSANLVVHEGGHNLFAWFGPTLCLWGGTLLQWLGPFLLATCFFRGRPAPGFCSACFSFSRTGSIPQPTWLTRGRRSCPWSQPAIRILWSTTSSRYSPASAC